MRKCSPIYKKCIAIEYYCHCMTYAMLEDSWNRSLKKYRCDIRRIYVSVYTGGNVSPIIPIHSFIPLASLSTNWRSYYHFLTPYGQTRCAPSCRVGYERYVHVHGTNIWFVHLPFRMFQMWCRKCVPGTCFASRTVWNEWVGAEFSAVGSSFACWRSLSVLAMTSIHSNWYVSGSAPMYIAF